MMNEVESAPIEEILRRRLQSGSSKRICFFSLN